MEERHNVTIVIPVYKDWATLSLCIESLKKYVDKRHTILLVNDRSSEWQELEKKICASIAGCQNFRYACNPENMGFVKTCNRAVMELDQTDHDVLLLNSDTQVTEGFLEEMLDVLYATEKHGVVCPRSNNATLLTMPLEYDGDRSKIIDQSYSLWKEMKDGLPRWSVVPTGVGFAFLIRRFLIRDFGLFDEVYGIGYNEENDLTLRVNQYGFSAVMANHAFVFHYESKSFTNEQKTVQNIKNEKTLLSRYPFYTNVVHHYFHYDCHPLEKFSILYSEDIFPKKRILFSLYTLNPVYNGTAVYGLTLLKYFYEKYHEKYEIHILVNREGDQFHHVSDQYPNVLYVENLTGVYHLALVPSQIYHLEQLVLLNRHCEKIVFTMQDIISLRCEYLLSENMRFRDIFRLAIKSADGIIYISDYTENDTKNYFNTVEQWPMGRRIYQGLGERQKHVDAGNTERLPFGEKQYTLVIGNSYGHKAIPRTLQELKKSSRNFVLFGYQENKKIAHNIYGLKSGMFSQSFIDELYDHADIVIFPSMYEGFGLPIIEAGSYGKRVIVRRSELNEELYHAFPELHDSVRFFRYFDELLPVLEQALKEQPLTKPVRIHRTWKDVAVETESFVASVLAAPLDQRHLLQRWEFYKYLERYRLGEDRCHPMNYQRFLKEFIRAHWPWLFQRLKAVKIYWLNRNQ